MDIRVKFFEVYELLKTIRLKQNLDSDNIRYIRTIYHINIAENMSKMQEDISELKSILILVLVLVIIISICMVVHFV